MSFYYFTYDMNYLIFLIASCFSSKSTHNLRILFLQLLSLWLSFYITYWVFIIVFQKFLVWNSDDCENAKLKKFLLFLRMLTNEFQKCNVFFISLLYLPTEIGYFFSNSSFLLKPWLKFALPEKMLPTLLEF